MPTYSYKCLKCGHEFDVMKAVHQMDSPELCAACSSAETRRQMTAASFKFAGKGWHKTDYGKWGPKR